MQKMYRQIKTYIKKFPLWFFVGLILIFLFLPYIIGKVYSSYKKIIYAFKKVDREERHELNEQMNPEEYASIGEHIRKKYNIEPQKFEELKVSAHKIAYAFGTLPSLSWYQRLTENDKEAYEELKKVVNYFPAVAELYYEFYTKSDNLRTRILDDLDAKEYRKLREYYLSHNKNYF